MDSFFNYRYFIQNIKKSKTMILVLMFGSFIMDMFILNGNLEGEFYSVLTVKDLFDVTLVNIFVFPSVLAIVLFEVIFKRKGNDFINSMPITRKTLFLTNTIGGVFIIIVSCVINNIAMYIYIHNNSNVEIKTYCAIKYMLIMILICIYIFTLSNLAVSLSGNKITSCVLILIIMFFAQFFVTYYGKVINVDIFGNNKENVVFVSNNEEYIAKDNFKISENTYKTSIGASYKNGKVTPLLILNENYYNQKKEYDIDNKVSTICMIILSLIYFILGLFVYQRKKMEHVEISFENVHIHQIVKCMTILPFFSLLPRGKIKDYEEVILFFIAMSIFIAYFWLYDIITRKKLVSITRNILYFAGISCIAFFIYETIDDIDKKNEKYMLSYHDIESITYNNSILDRDIIITSDELKKYIIKQITDKSNINIAKKMLDTYGYKEETFELKTTEGRFYHVGIYVQTKKEYKEFTSILEKSVDIDDILKECFDSTKDVCIYNVSMQKCTKLDVDKREKVKQDLLSKNDKTQWIFPYNDNSDYYMNLYDGSNAQNKKVYIFTYDYDGMCHHMIAPIE